MRFEGTFGLVGQEALGCEFAPVELGENLLVPARVRPHLFARFRHQLYSALDTLAVAGDPREEKGIPKVRLGLQDLET